MVISFLFSEGSIPYFSKRWSPWPWPLSNLGVARHRPMKKASVGETRSLPYTSSANQQFRNLSRYENRMSKWIFLLNFTILNCRLITHINFTDGDSKISSLTRCYYSIHKKNQEAGGKKGIEFDEMFNLTRFFLSNNQSLLYSSADAKFASFLFSFFSASRQVIIVEM